MRGNEYPIHVANGVLGKQCHICAFFNGFDEQHRVLRSFIKEGFERGDKAFHIVDPELREDHLKRLAEAGIDVEQAIATGQLELRRWQDAYLRDDRFDQDGMLALLEEVLGSGAAAGNPLIRFVSRVEPSLVDKAGEDNWLEYETRVNYAVSKYQRSGNLHLRSDELPCQPGDGHVAGSPCRDCRRGAPGEPVLCSSRPIPP